MKLMFIQGGSRWRIDEDQNLYNDTTYNEKTWAGYKKYCDKLNVALRSDDKIYPRDEAKRQFNLFNSTIADGILLPDLYANMMRYLNRNKRKQVTEKIMCAVKSSDALIVSSLGNYYVNKALKFARKFDVPILIEVTGFIFEVNWYHGIKGKVLALFREVKARKEMAKANFACYVTNEALQKRYTCKGKWIGCSDVVIAPNSADVLQRRIERIHGMRDRKTIIIGTAAHLDLSLKGHAYVIKAIAKLKKMGYGQYLYQLIGTGSGSKLLRLAKKLGVENQVEIIGALPHERVFDWMDSLDIYVHPSLFEGLCRSIVEAMSRACPVVCANVGGNSELIEEEYLYNPKSVGALCQRILAISYQDEMEKEANRNFDKAKEYNKEKLEAKRDAFYQEFFDYVKTNKA